MPIHVDDLVFKATSAKDKELLRDAAALAIEHCRKAISGHPLLAKTEIEVGSISVQLKRPPPGGDRQATIATLAAQIAAQIQGHLAAKRTPTHVNPSGNLVVGWGGEGGPGQGDSEKLREDILKTLDANGSLLAFVEVRLRFLLACFTSPEAAECLEAKGLSAARRGLAQARESLSISIRLAKEGGIPFRRIPKLGADTPTACVCEELSAAARLIHEYWSRRGKELARSGALLEKKVLEALQTVVAVRVLRAQGPFASLKPSGGSGSKPLLFHHGCSLEFAKNVVFKNIKLEARGKGEFGLGFYVYEDNPTGAAGTGQKFSKGRKDSQGRPHTHWGVIQFSVPQQIFDKYITKKLTFADPEVDQQQVYDPHVDETKIMTWHEFVSFNRSKKAPHKKGHKLWDYQLVKGPLMPFRNDKSVRQIRLAHEGIDMLNDPATKREMIDQGPV